MFVRFQETVHKNSCRRFIPKIARCTRQMNAEAVSCATFPDLRIEVVEVLRGDGVLEPLVRRYQFISEISPNFPLRFGQRSKLPNVATY